MKKLILVAILKVTEENSNKEPNPELDPLVRGTDPRIRIRTKMSQIRNTGDKRVEFRGVLRTYFSEVAGNDGAACGLLVVVAHECVALVFEEPDLQNFPVQLNDFIYKN